MKKKKKRYSKPKVVYEKQIETLAGVCGPDWIGPTPNCCMQTSCVKRET